MEPPLGEIPIGSQALRDVCASFRGVGPRVFMKVCYFLGLENFKMEGRAWLKGPVFGNSGLGNTLTCPESGAWTPWPVSQDLMGHQEGVKQGPSDFPLVFPDPTSPADCSPQALGNGCSGLPPPPPQEALPSSQGSRRLGGHIGSTLAENVFSAPDQHPHASF